MSQYRQSTAWCLLNTEASIPASRALRQSHLRRQLFDLDQTIHRWMRDATIRIVAGRWELKEVGVRCRTAIDGPTIQQRRGVQRTRGRYGGRRYVGCAASHGVARTAHERPINTIAGNECDQRRYKGKISDSDLMHITASGPAKARTGRAAWRREGTDLKAGRDVFAGLVMTGLSISTGARL